jgi:hypothetical protein
MTSSLTKIMKNMKFVEEDGQLLIDWNRETEKNRIMKIILGIPLTF